MTQFRRVLIVLFGTSIAIAAYASCEDIKASCQKNFDLDLAYCNKQPSNAQENCFKRAHEALISCVGSCR